MAKFSLIRPIKLVVKGATQVVIPNPSGIPVVVNTPSVMVDLKVGINEINDQEIIDRIRKDQMYNVPEGIIEISEEEQEAVKIHEKKHKEAEEEIKEIKKKKKS